MKKSLFIIGLLISGCAGYQPQIPQPDLEQRQTLYDYRLNLNDRSEDTFKITLLISSLSSGSHDYHFVRTVPGSYSILDIGRYVKSFEAFTSEDEPVPVFRRDINTFAWNDTARVQRIEYKIQETWDTPADSNAIPRMSGSSIEEDHSFFNPHAVFGFIDNLQNAPIRLTLEYPDSWECATPAWNKLNNQYFMNNFRDLINCPFLMGRLSREQLRFRSLNIDIAVYSRNDRIHASDIEKTVKNAVKSVIHFMGRVPLAHYTFLFHFDDQPAGAHEFLSSSTYVLKEDVPKNLNPAILRIAAHEFYHLLTPLSLRETMIDQFNYREAEPTQHLWFYEGITEWAASTSLLRYGVIDINDYLRKISADIRHYEEMIPGESLVDMSLNAYQKHNQFIYIYSKGAVTATMMDILLLHETEGRKGLRDVMNTLSLKFVHGTPFQTEDFFDLFAEASHPAVRPFLENYIIGNQPLPLEQTFPWLGIQYFPVLEDDHSRAGLGYGLLEVPGRNGMVIKSPDNRAQEMGFQLNDTLLVINSQEMNPDNFQEILNSLGVGQRRSLKSYSALVKRGKNRLNLNAHTVRLRFQHAFKFGSRARYDTRFLLNKWRDG